MGLFFEKLAQYLFATIALILIYTLKINADDFDNFKDILSSSINISAITAGFLATSMSLLITLTNEGIIQKLKQFGLYSSLINYLKSAVGWTFIVAVISASGLFLNDNSSNSNAFFYIWTFACVVGIFSVIRVIRILSKILDRMSE